MQLKKSTIIVAIFILVVVTGCEVEDGSIQPEPTATKQVVPTPMNDTNVVSEIVKQIESGIDANVEIPEPDPENDKFTEPTSNENYCVDCHTDKDRLIDTAKQELEIEPENEGEG